MEKDRVTYFVLYCENGQDPEGAKPEDQKLVTISGEDEERVIYHARTIPGARLYKEVPLE